MVSRPRRVVVDTHPIWWYLKFPQRLSRMANDIFRSAAGGECTLVIPAIAVAELYYVSAKLGQPMTPSNMLEELGEIRGIEFRPLGRSQLEYLHLLPEIPEMHDRLIVADSLLLGVPLLTRDRDLVASSQIETIW